ncbi:type VI immunity family protein [Nocardia sp. NPDC057663]|uniref:type VI immunity family protein n=1 Tax=Nocardia sp. NPDC057663 TaxID=3346201 RepID=UPI00366DCE34
MLETTASRILTVLSEIAELEGDEPEPGPRPPASASAVAEARRARDGGFSPEYLDFLRLHDGWPEFPWGIRLFGTIELTDDESYPYYQETLEDCEAPEDLMNALIVGASGNDPSLVLLLGTGEVVDFLYEERARYSGFGAFLADRLTAVESYLEQLLQRAEAARTDWTPEHRAAKEARLLVELRCAATIRPRAVVSFSTPPPAHDPMPAAVEPGDLRVGRKKPKASVMLGLVLYLGSYPAPDEVIGCFRAFRRHFPVEGTMTWAVPNAFGGFPEDAEHPDDESWSPQMRVDVGGHFGIRISVRAKDTAECSYTLNIRGIPPADDDRPRAAFCEVIVPVDEDPERLARLTTELTELLPVRSGYGGYSAYVWDSDAAEDPYQRVFSWCRRFFALDVGQVDGWLEAATEHVVGAGWLTVLGSAFVTHLAGPSLPAFTTPGITVTRAQGGGVVIRASERPSLGDVHRGEYPVAVAEVDRYLLPLKTGGWHHTSTWWATPGQAWQLTYGELPGGFADHRATSAWLTRLIDPQRFLGPTARERGEELLDQLSRRHGGDWADQWRTDPDDFAWLLGLLTDAADPAAGPESVTALEFVTAFPDDAPAQAYNRLIYAYLLGDHLDRAEALLPAALEYAPRAPYIFHNAACVAARAGDHGRALEFVRVAKQHGYADFASILEDEDLRDLHDNPAFIALFTSGLGPRSDEEEQAT